MYSAAFRSRKIVNFVTFGVFARSSRKIVNFFKILDISGLERKRDRGGASYFRLAYFAIFATSLLSASLAKAIGEGRNAALYKPSQDWL